MRALRAAARIERHVAAALQAAGDVPVGFAVTDVIDGRLHLFFVMPRESGASNNHNSLVSRSAPGNTGSPACAGDNGRILV